MQVPLTENYSRRFAARELELQREIAEDRRKIAQRKLRQELLESWLEQRVLGTV